MVIYVGHVPTADGCKACGAKLPLPYEACAEQQAASALVARGYLEAPTSTERAEDELVAHPVPVAA